MATLLSCTFIDLDKYIEEHEGKSIPEIFRECGEAGFRKIEKEALGRVTGSYQSSGITVLALGGGTLTAEGCEETVKARTLCIYLRATIGTLVQNLEKDFQGRPMLESEGDLRSRIQSLMEHRAGIYERTAALSIDIDGKSFKDIASEIAVALRRKGIVGNTGGSSPVPEENATLWDPLRKKDVALTPEEKVRQWCIRFLNRQMGVPLHMMMSETGFRLGDKQFRADILVYDRKACPLAVVECKRPEIQLGKEVMEQAIRYNMVLDVKYIIISNGHKTFIFRKGPEGYRPEAQAPSYEEMLK